MAGLNLTHVAYKGGNPAQLDLMAGNVNMMITQPNSKDLITTGKMRALAVSSAKRSQYYPELPTVAEAGVPGYESVAWYGLVGPKGMPPDLVKKIADETVKACCRRRRQVHRRRARAATWSPAPRPSSPTSSWPSASATRRSCAKPT